MNEQGRKKLVIGNGSSRGCLVALVIRLEFLRSGKEDGAEFGNQGDQTFF